MNIEGWAGKENENDLAQESLNKEFKLVVIRNIQDWIVVESSKSGYASKTYKGYLKPGHPGFTVNELAVYFDGGNLCFGGRGNISGNRFEITVYTD